MVEISSSPQRAHFAAKFLLKSERCANLMFGAKNFCRNFSTKIILKVAKKKSNCKNPRLGLLRMSCIIFFCNELLALQKRKKESTTLGFLRSYLPDLRLSLCKMCALFLSPSMHPATKLRTPYLKMFTRKVHPGFCKLQNPRLFPNNRKGLHIPDFHGIFIQ